MEGVSAGYVWVEHPSGASGAYGAFAAAVEENGAAVVRFLLEAAEVLDGFLTVLTDMPNVERP